MEPGSFDRISRIIGASTGRRSVFGLMAAAVSAAAGQRSTAAAEPRKPAAGGNHSLVGERSAPAWITRALDLEVEFRDIPSPASPPSPSERKSGGGKDTCSKDLTTCRRQLSSVNRDLSAAIREVLRLQNTIAANNAQFRCSLDAAYLTGMVDQYCYTFYDSYGDAVEALCKQDGRVCTSQANACQSPDLCLTLWDSYW